MAQTTTIHEELIDELSLLVEGLKGNTERGGGPREYLNGLLRDVYVIERCALLNEGQEDSAWLAPFLEALLSKLELGATVIPKGAAQIATVTAQVEKIRERNLKLASLRKDVSPLLADPETLRSEARAQLEKSNVIAGLEAKRLLRGTGKGAPEIMLAARLLEGVGLHLAMNQAEGRKNPNDDDLKSLANRLEGWLAELGASVEKPEVGAAPGDKARTIQGSQRAAGIRSGCVSHVLVPGFSSGGEQCSRAVVIVSAGAEAKVLAAARTVLEAVPEDRVRMVLPFLEAVGAALSARMEDPECKEKLRAEAALDVVGAVLPALEGSDGLQEILKALQEDFSGADVELLLPSPGAPFAEGCGWESRDLFSREVAPGTMVKLLRPGMKLAGELVRPALVQVSQGPPPPGVVDEVLELLPKDEDRAKHLAERIERARCLAAGDAGGQLARELADLALFIRDDHLAEPARRALRLVIDEPPAGLVGAEGWEAVREFLDENLETLYEDGENGEVTAHRLVRPYLQGLRTHDMAGARLRALGESMGAMLTLYDEVLGETARAWLFSELERLAGGEGLAAGGHARRLMRTAAKSVGEFYKNGETTPAMELTQALGRAGVKVFPEDESTLDTCPSPDQIFHRFEAVHSEEDRFAVVGEFEPAATIEGGGLAETGAITVSLGPEPAILACLDGEAIKGSRLGAAAKRLKTELVGLNRERMIAELRGDAGAERGFALGAAERITSALKEAGWSRGTEEREAFGELFQILHEEYHVDILPGYLTYRRLHKLEEDHGEAVKVKIVREGPKQVKIASMGFLYRDELVGTLDMTWGVGNPPAYVQHLRDALPWFNAVLEGSKPGIKLSPGTVEAIKDFESPDAGSLEGVARSLRVIATWLATEVRAELENFCKQVRNAPGLEVDFFPLPDRAYDNKRLLTALDQAKSPDAIEIVRDTARDDGVAIAVEQIALYKDGRLISDEPRAKFSLKKLPQACSDLQKAIDPILGSTNVVRQVKSELKGQVTRMALLEVGAGQHGVEMNCFKTLLKGKLIDPGYEAEPENVLYKGGAYLVGRLESANLIKVERFEGATTIDDALKGYDKDAAEISDVFCLEGGAELSEVRRPLVVLEESVIQKASLMRGVPTADGEVLEFDKVLVDTSERLKSWQEGTGQLTEPLLGKTEKAIIPRTLKRLKDVRGKMFRQQKKKLAVLPPDTARRDLIKFIIDQVHRAEDSLAIIEDQSYRGTFGELVFKDVIFRSQGPYLAKYYRTSIDTAVVAGADTQALTGKFKKEASGPKPKRENLKIWSVIIPCYTQDGVTIRPATVRVGSYF